MDREIGKTFTKISSVYDKARTSYPAQLINDILTYSEVKQNSTILDVGCGTGQVTFLFAQRGYSVLGLDFGKDMIDIAKEKCSSLSLPHLDFKVGTFESTELSDASFDIITSGMAWHWINPEGREEKVYRILKDRGTLALFWSYQQKKESDFVKQVSTILDRYGGADSGPAGQRVKTISDDVYQQLKTNPLFTSFEVREYQENLTFSKQRYLDLVISYGWCQKLSEEKRNSLIEDLQELFKKYDEPLLIPYKYVSVLAKKNGNLPS